MKISVIVPVFNSENFLSACIDSIIQQTYKNLEIILIDDGSIDKSPQICDEYAKKDSRIVVIHQENAGVSSARNKGLDIATGDLITFVDSDDTIDKDMYEFLIDLMFSNEADVSHCGYKRVCNGSVKPINDTKAILVQNKMEALSCLVSGRIFTGALWNKLIKKNVIEKIRFIENIKINEDILFCFETFMGSSKIVFADYPKYNYLEHESSTSEVKKQEKLYKDRCFVNECIHNRLLSTELNYIARNRYLSSLISYYRYCVKYNKPKAIKIKNKILVLADDMKNLGKKMHISVWLIKFCPFVYRIVYSIYDRIRKPDWDVSMK